MNTPTLSDVYGSSATNRVRGLASRRFLLALLLGYCIVGLTLRPVRAQDAAAEAAPGDAPPFMEVIPAQNGTELEIVGDWVDHQTGFVANLASVQQTADGPTGFKGSYTMTYSDTVAAYVATFSGFAPRTAVAGTVNLTSTAGISTTNAQFNRTFLESRSTAGHIQSPDGGLLLTLPNTQTLGFDTYVVVTENVTPPGPAPVGHRLIGKSYSVRAPKSVPATAKAMRLQLFYEPEELDGADAHTLAVYAWNGTTKQWQRAGGELVDQSLREPPHVRLGNVKAFTVYTLMVSNTWQDVFSDVDGLDPNGAHLDISLVDGVPGLSLLTPISDSATSLPIIPPSDIVQWGTISFTAGMNTPTTTLTVDVLNLENALILSNVASGDNLAELGLAPTQPIRLRVTMTSTVADVTPMLADWQVSWQTPAPVTLRAGAGAADLGDTVTITLTLADPPALAIGALAFEVAYDPVVLQATACTMLLAPGAFAFCNVHFDADGVARDAARFTVLANQTITTELPIATLNFTVVGRAAVTPLDVRRLQLTDATGKPLATVAVDGQVQIAAGVPGDVNCDGVADRTDAAFILEFDAGLRSAGPTCAPPQETLFLPHCDLNQDGACTLLDALPLVMP